ncbi:lipid kinase [Pontibacillus halophilus JSM 076056 = DSM 19796]|uniref:Lipid kinase n=1 Tax=Pontibacillus halophilus JSM 076056 = DSM 19796 TaxID=1385510 RepID=A0A0A5GF04_9BACI|nr:YegS/Rv2252/BmrU family lipid kinase [Pontibacillus halophilus]KGX90554.1 lipid kinase [Pontibacillus halophilus JSM 076056 = DSM 19796]
MEYEKGLFLYNGASGEGEVEQKLTSTLPILVQHVKELVTIHTSSKEEFIDELKSRGQEVDIVYLLGGDGTIHDAVNALAPLEKRPVVAILPGGTCNDFSRMLGMPQNLEDAARSILNGRQAPVDVAQANERYFVNFWGIGMITEASENIDQRQKKRFGPLSYFISAFKTIQQATPFSFRMVLNDGEQVLDEEAVLVLVLNGRYIGTRQIPLPHNYVNDGKLDVLIVKNSTLKSFQELLSLNRPWKREEELQDIFYMQADSVTIETKDEMQVDTDGEIHTSTPSEMVMLRNHMSFIFADEPS